MIAAHSTAELAASLAIFADNLSLALENAIGRGEIDPDNLHPIVKASQALTQAAQQARAAGAHLLTVRG